MNFLNTTNINWLPAKIPSSEQLYILRRTFPASLFNELFEKEAQLGWKLFKSGLISEGYSDLARKDDIFSENDKGCKCSHCTDYYQGFTWDMEKDEIRLYWWSDVAEARKFISF